MDKELMPCEVELERSWNNAIHLRWTPDLANVDRRSYEDLADALAALDGVEAVVMRRYSAQVTTASHVIELPEAAARVADVVLETLAELKRVGYRVSVMDVTLDADEEVDLGSAR